MIADTYAPGSGPAGLFRGLARIAGRPGKVSGRRPGSVGSLGPR